MNGHRVNAVINFHKGKVVLIEKLDNLNVLYFLSKSLEPKQSFNTVVKTPNMHAC